MSGNKTVVNAKYLLCIAFISRVAIILLASGVAHWVFERPYDSSALVHYEVPVTNQTHEYHMRMHKPLGHMDAYIKKSLGIFANWDAIFFTHIAKEGYTHEQFHAFFPGYPLLMRYVSHLWSMLIIPKGISEMSSILISGLLISNVSFILASLVAYKITYQLWKDAQFAFLTFLVFISSPANIFFTSLYTESLFTLLNVTGLWFIVNSFEEINVKEYKKKDLDMNSVKYASNLSFPGWINTIMAALFFMLASSVRSNGVILVGLLGYPIFYYVGDQFLKRRLEISKFLKLCLLMIPCAFLILLPIVLFQFYGYALYCHTDESRPWCRSKLPNLYSFVQEEYWGVGFLRYYEVKQIPNFILATPVLILSITGILSYIFYDLKRAATLGLRPTKQNGQVKAFYSTRTFLFILHWLILLCVSIFYLHIQVSTRFLFSQCLPLYWWIAHLLMQRGLKLKFLLLLIIYIYNLLGIILFPTFYPWT